MRLHFFEQNLIVDVFVDGAQISNVVTSDTEIGVAEYMPRGADDRPIVIGPNRFLTRWIRGKVEIKFRPAQGFSS